MTTKKVGALIKEARTNAGLTQEKLARMIPGLSATDISGAERGEKALTQEQLKSIARATGVTQKSLLEAAGTAKKTTSTRTTASKKTTGTKSTAKTTTGTSMKVTATEKRLVELYRAADTDTKKKAMAILRGNEEDEGFLGALLDSALETILKK